MKAGVLDKLQRTLWGGGAQQRGSKHTQFYTMCASFDMTLQSQEKELEGKIFDDASLPLNIKMCRLITPSKLRVGTTGISDAT